MANDYDVTIVNDLISLFDTETYTLKAGRHFQGKEKLPAIYIYMLRCKEVIRGTGVYTGEFMVQAKTKAIADLDEAKINSQAKAIRDVFKVTDLLDKLNTATTNNTYFGIMLPGNAKVPDAFHELRDEARFFNYPVSISFSPTKAG
jgi:hypothetical protein